MGKRDLLHAVFRGLRSLEYRSEEHTSELQSRLHLVCRLLLEKKKKYAFLLLNVFKTRYISLTRHMLATVPAFEIVLTKMDSEHSGDCFPYVIGDLARCVEYT